MSEIQPFTIAIDDEALRDLRERLARTRWPDPGPGDAWEYGTDLGSLQELCRHWQEKYDWRAHEAALNRLDHFVTEIEGERLHFVHARSKHAQALPLLLTHGWPGSIFEFMEILPMLTDPEAHGGRAEDAFHVVAPSMPGYGFSGPTRTRGVDAQRVAELEIALMQRLGYARYGAQGGDWGAIVTTQVGRLDPSHCAGIHINMAIAFPPDPANPLAGLSDQEKQWVAETQAFTTGETGYQEIQGSKPQTLATALNDSPAGLASWILEKFRSWSDCDGDVAKRFTMDQLLTNLSIYWFTQTIGSSIRLYYETRKSGRLGFTQGRIEVPTGVAVFPKELYKAPRAWLEPHYAVRHFEVMPRGGHFAAMEEPGLLAGDVRRFFAGLR